MLLINYCAVSNSLIANSAIPAPGGFIPGNTGTLNVQDYHGSCLLVIFVKSCVVYVCGQFYLGGISHPWKIFCPSDYLDHGVAIVGYGISTYLHVFGLLLFDVESEMAVVTSKY